MADIEQAVQQLLVEPPIQLLRINPTAPNLIGEGDLPPYAPPPPFQAYGVAFSAVFIPPQLGRDSGTPPVYVLPLLRLFLYSRAGGTLELLVEQYQFHIPEPHVRFLGQGISRIHYIALPGVEWAWGYID